MELERINDRLARAMAFAERRGDLVRQTQAELPWLIYMAAQFVAAVDRRGDPVASAAEDYDAPQSREFWGRLRPVVSRLVVERSTAHDGFVLELLSGLARGVTGDGRAVIQPVTGFRVVRAS